MMNRNLLFVIYSADVVDPYGISILSAVARNAGWNVDLAEFNIRTIDWVFQTFRPDLVAYSVMSSYVDDYLKINTYLKRKYTFVSVMGGAHPTYFPEVIEVEGIDYICRGEGDGAFKEFLTEFAEGRNVDNVANFWSKKTRNTMRSLTSDLDSLPMPDRGLIFDRIPIIGQSPYKTFMPSRGCPYACTYCHNAGLVRELRGKGPLVRTCSVARLIAEIRWVQERYPLRFIKFMDDLFAVNTSWLQEFADAYAREIGVPFTCMQRLESITHDRLPLLRRAGCVSVSVSLDSVVARIRNEVLGRRMQLTNDEIRQRFLMIKAHGINILSNVILGVPTSSTQDAIDTIKFYIESRVDFAQATILVPYPRTPIWDYCQKEGYLSRQDKASNYGLFQAMSTLTCFTQKEKEVQWNMMVFFPAMGHWPKLQKCFLWMAMHMKPNSLFAMFYTFLKAYLYNRYIFPAKGCVGSSVPIFLKTLKLEVRRMMGKEEQDITI
ncbi:MAG: hypothetical protein A2498_11060 [Lentisphaerae bacterium RIFOXYC12_FULL_60_16]|nr:MAG: hypothetical protein A2498_11060 [Lentisphaerae bacterium RIFOXYC12_FULL_60_16]